MTTMRCIPASLAIVLTLGVAVGPAPGQQRVPPSPFDLTDTNRDGRITPEEYRARMVEVFFLLDRNKDGSLVRDEIPGASEAAFRAADKSGDGRLSIAEYQDARSKDYEAADSNKDGGLSRNETAGK
jgi:hypothetical protein